MGYIMICLLLSALFFVIGFLIGIESENGSITDFIEDLLNAIDLIKDRRTEKGGKHDV